MRRLVRLDAAGLIEGAVESEVFAAEQFGYVDDLAVVQSEMFYDLVNGAEAARGVALDLEGRLQIRLAEAVEHARGFFHGGVELREQLCGRDRVPFGEFAWTLAAVFLFGEGSHQPLAHVAI